MVYGGGIAPVILDAGGDIVGGRVACDDFVDTFLQQVADIGFEAADGGAEHGGFGDDVRRGAGVDLGDGNHRLVQGIDIARDDGLDGLDHADHGHDRVDAFVRRRPMAAPAGDVDGGGVDRRHQRAGRGQEMAERHARGVVDAVNLGDGETVHHPFLHHDLAPGPILFCRLKDQRHAARKTPRLGQVLGGPQKHGHMAVMAAGVHLAGHGRGMGGARGLDNRQGIHVGAQADGGARTLTVDEGDDAGSGDAFVNLVHPDLAQAVRDEGGGLDAVKAQLGVGMQVAPPGLHFRAIRGDTIEDGHGTLLFAL